MSSDFWRNKLTSRKFIMSVIAFLFAFGTGLTGLIEGNEVLSIIGAVCVLVSSSLYAAIEGSIDKARIENEIRG